MSEAAPWADVRPGESRALHITVSESYSGAEIRIPIVVHRAQQPGPTVAVTAAVHGDEINGVGAIRDLITNRPFQINKGALVLAPVVALPGFERHSRYLPDRRDLNRCFPGSSSGSLAGRLARAFFDQVIRHCDYCIDLHSAAVRRTNFPNVRADLSKAPTRRLAMAFGCELVLHGKGPQGSLRRTATEAGCPSIILEAGEVWKIEPAVVEIGLRGVRNVLIELDMVEGQPVRPPYQATVLRSTWVRAEQGGILQFHVAPGEPVSRRQALATVTDLLGRALHVLDAPRDGVVLGLSTMPAVKPGEPVCHLAHPQGGLKRIRAALAGADAHSLAERLRHDLATNVEVQAAGGG
ncbi:MAG: succinylglutamate desuccinylase/aspartoacylase family protein [Phycisphaerales bacterium]|nr:succinylglutamate desuccinylase/aspartoacylase family protein [Phycisphaerales bacterium]